MSTPKINTLNDLNNLRSAPCLEPEQLKSLTKELSFYMEDADWFTIGIMAPSSKIAIVALEEMQQRFNWPSLKIKENPEKDGPVFLKANQKTGDIHIRIEYGLGEGILISCQHEEEKKDTSTFGPFPLNFF